jgi:hypothetical protein
MVKDVEPHHERGANWMLFYIFAASYLKIFESC